MTATSAPLSAGALGRWTAFLLDQFVLGSLWFLLSSWIGVVYLTVSRWPGDLRSLAALAAVLGAFGLFLHATYWIVFLGGCGQTPGKIVLGLEVVSRSGSAVGYGRATCRWLGMLLAVLPLGLGFLGVLMTRDRRGLHDWLAGTRVVRAPSARADFLD